LRYLLGALPSAEREAFELRLMEDEQFSEAIEAEEFDLIDEFAAGKLSASERNRIKGWIEASPELRNRVLIAQRLHHIRPGRRQWHWWLLGAATATACLLLLIITRTSRHSVPAPTPSAVAALPARSVQQDTILLAAVRQRGAATAEASAVYIVHPANATRLQILLPPSARSTAYTVQLQNTQPMTNIKPQGPADSPYLELTFPPGTLRATGYQITLESVSEHYEIAFRVSVQ
jgi:anti-sigma-K factor RskA